MRLRRLVRALAWGLPAVLLALVADVAAAQQEGTLAGYRLVGNGTGLTAVSADEVRALLRGERELWDTRVPVVVVLPSGRAPFAEALANRVFAMSHAEMRRYWLARVFQGRAAPPVFLDSREEAVARVRRTPGAIALVPAADDLPAELLVRITP